MTDIIELIGSNEIKKLIYTIKAKDVIMDGYLANLNQVEIKNLNRAVKRKTERFPKSFCFQMTEEENRKLEVPICGRCSTSN